jgi:hypothetical protein
MISAIYIGEIDLESLTGFEKIKVMKITYRGEILGM